MGRRRLRRERHSLRRHGEDACRSGRCGAGGGSGLSSGRGLGGTGHVGQSRQRALRGERRQAHRHLQRGVRYRDRGLKDALPLQEPRGPVHGQIRLPQPGPRSTGSPSYSFAPAATISTIVVRGKSSCAQDVKSTQAGAPYTVPPLCCVTMVRVGWQRTAGSPRTVLRQAQDERASMRSGRPFDRAQGERFGCSARVR